MNKKALIVLIVIIAITASLFLIVGIKSAKITTFEECEKVRWLVRSITIYDGYGPIEAECVLKSGKKFVKSRFSNLIKIENDHAMLLENCAKANIPQTSDDTSLDPANKTVTVWWWDNKLQNNVALKLPYEPETGFAGCSESAKKKLQDIQQMYESSGLRH